MLEINSARLHGSSPEIPVSYVRASLFDWRPDDAYDVVFFGFWLSHVPPRCFSAFWDLVRSALRPGGRGFFVDSLRDERPRSAHTTVRRLNDGREFRVVKIFYDPDVLAARLADMGWRFSMCSTENYLLYGFGEPRA